MREQISGQFTIEGQVEDIFGSKQEMARIAHISQTCQFIGTLEGESLAEYTAILPREGNGGFRGFQRISGTLGERTGTFVVQVTGEFVRGRPRGIWEVVPKSGSGDFVHIRGTGTFLQSSEKAGNYDFEFDLRKPRKPRATTVAESAATAESESPTQQQQAMEKPVSPSRSRQRSKSVNTTTEPVDDKTTRRRKTTNSPTEPVSLPTERTKPVRARKSKAA